MVRALSERLTLSSSAEMALFGKKLSATFRPGDTIALIGDLGSGKTTLVQGIAAGWGYKGDVVSPTFSLVNEYVAAKGTIYHMDMYRLTPKECAVFPLEDYFDPKALRLMEWADRVQSRWPQGTIEIRLKHAGGNKRVLLVKRPTHV